MKPGGCLKVVIASPLLAVVMLYFGFSFLGQYGDKKSDAMPDEQVEQYVRDRITIGSDRSVVDTFIENEKEDWPYYSTPEGTFGSRSYYALQYAKGTYKLWIGGYNYCRVFVYLDEDDQVSEIKLQRSVGPWP